MTTRRKTHSHKQVPENGQRVDGSAANSESIQEEPADGSANSTMERAEELVDRMAAGIGHYAGVIGHGLLWFAARLREETEDIWAEAQAQRRKMNGGDSAEADGQQAKSDAEPARDDGHQRTSGHRDLP